jgi:hypothetical protein
MSKQTSQEKILEFIRTRGVTRCPTAFVAVTESRPVSNREATALRRHAEDLEALQSAKRARFGRKG